MYYITQKVLIIYKSLHVLVLKNESNRMEMILGFTKFDEMIDVSKLKPSRFQRNKHSKEQIERLAKIMAVHKVRHPIHVKRGTKEICFGHGRLAAAKINGWKKYPIVFQDFENDEEEYACVQSDNAIALWAELDLAHINLDMEDLGPDLDIDLLGIKNFTLDPAEKYNVPPPKDKDHTQNYKEEGLAHECPECGCKFSD